MFRCFRPDVRIPTGHPAFKVTLAVSLLVGASTATAGAPEQSGTFPPIRIEVAFPNLEFDRPIVLTHHPKENRFYLAEQGGRIYAFRNRPEIEQAEITTALDIHRQVRREHNVEGLLGLAFHPHFPNPREAYVRYSAGNPSRTILARFQVDPDGRIDDASKEILLAPHDNQRPHIGGGIAFGPDGYLYVPIGDGGPQHDPEGHGQNLQTLRGSILRLDIDRAENGKPYAIPPDNPFVDEPDARPEIYAYGLRNPWRLSFDSKNGNLWIGDVGQNAYEEIDVIKKGGNYGWPAREGFHPHEGGQKTADMIDPIYDYPRKLGVSVTGGHVYRGQAIPGLTGAYLFADFATGRLWAIRYEGKKPSTAIEIGHVPSPVSFGTDAQGEIYICSFDGKIYKILPDA